jgi:hypothetical protein
LIEDLSRPWLWFRVASIGLGIPEALLNYLVRVQGGELHRAERETHSAQLANRDATLVQLESRYDVAVALLIFAGAIGVVAVMSRST